MPNLKEDEQLRVEQGHQEELETRTPEIRIPEIKKPEPKKYESTSEIEEAFLEHLQCKKKTSAAPGPYKIDFNLYNTDMVDNTIVNDSQEGLLL